MTETPAQRKANLKYKREKMKFVNVSFSPNEADLWEHLQSQDNKAGYIKDLIRQDMESNK